MLTMRVFPGIRSGRTKERRSNALPVFVLEMGRHVGLMHQLSPVWSNWISLLLSTPVVLWMGAPFFARGWRSVVDMRQAQEL